MKETLNRLVDALLEPLRRLLALRRFRGALREAFIRAVLTSVSEVLEKDLPPAKVKSTVRSSLGKLLKSLRLGDVYAGYLDDLLFPVIDQLVDRYYPDKLFILNELERHLRKVV
jgi:hypothetical protein